MLKLLFSIVIFPIIIFAQPDDVQFEYLSVDDGLSTSFVICIAQDHRGFMWFGTANGLNKYDGYTFTTFKHNPFDTTGLNDNIIYALCVDQSGYLWIGTGSGGLNRYDPGTESFVSFKHNPKNPQSLSSNNILSICQSKNGDLWIGTEGGGLNQLIFKPESITSDNPLFRKLYHDPDNQSGIAGNTINTIIEDSKGNVWIGTTRGLSRISFDEKNRVSIRNYRYNALIPNSLSHNNVSAICEDEHENLWIGTKGGGLNRFSSRDEKFYHYHNKPGNDLSLSNNNISTIKTDNNDDGVLWIGTFTGGINRLDIKSGKVKRYEAISEFYLHLKNYVLDIWRYIQI
jgi:ligand-binding sensor domain-containing protein